MVCRLRFVGLMWLVRFWLSVWCGYWVWMGCYWVDIEFG